MKRIGTFASVSIISSVFFLLIGTYGDEIIKMYDAFVKAGGEVIVCPHCAKAAGFDEKSRRPGARMSKEGDDLADVLIAADKVVDF